MRARPGRLTGVAGVTSRPPSAAGTYYVLAVLGKGRFDEHGAQGEAKGVLCVTHAKLPAGKTGLENTSQRRYLALSVREVGQWGPCFRPELEGDLS